MNHEEHLQLACRFERTARYTLLSEGPPDWVAVMLHYASLHYIEACLARENHHPRSKEQIRRMLRQLFRGRPNTVFRHFQILGALSYRARYGEGRKEGRQLGPQDAADAFRHLEAIKEELGIEEAASEELQASLIEEMAAVPPERLPELVERVERKRDIDGMHDIMELKGLGKEFWRSIDVRRYIQEERNSWR